MTTTTSKVFRSGNSVAVRLPKNMAYDEGLEVTIERRGDVLTISPKRPTIKEMVAKLRAVDAPIEIEERDVEDIPERPGL